MTDPIVQALWNYGYFFSPEVAKIDPEISEDNLDKLSTEGEPVRTAVELYQEWFIEELNRRSRFYHRREADIDGIIGPATEHLILMSPRCGMPDYASPDDSEEARFPDDCRESITTSYKMSLSGLSSDKLRELWIRADQNWADVLNVGFKLELEDYPNTNIYAFEEALGGSILADQFLSQGSCRNRLRGRFDNRRWSEGLFLATCTHEHGHALGLGHLRDSRAIMYPSIHSAGIARGGTPNDSDIRAMVGLGYKRKTSPPPKPPDDDKPKEVGRFEYKGETFTVNVTSDPNNEGGWTL